jgi:hypothetical protein
LYILTNDVAHETNRPLLSFPIPAQSRGDRKASRHDQKIVSLVQIDIEHVVALFRTSVDRLFTDLVTSKQQFPLSHWTIK